MGAIVMFPQGYESHHFKDQVPRTIELEGNPAVLAFPMAPTVRKGELHGIQSCYVIMSLLDWDHWDSSNHY